MSAILPPNRTDGSSASTFLAVTQFRFNTARLLAAQERTSTVLSSRLPKLTSAGFLTRRGGAITQQPAGSETGAPAAAVPTRVPGVRNFQLRFGNEPAIVFATQRYPLRLRRGQSSVFVRQAVVKLLAENAA